jgi:long-chain acyl-CoA synthetase
MDVRTIPELLQYALRTHRKPDAFLIKLNGRWEPISMAAVIARIASVSSALRDRGIVPGDRVAILAESRLEWAIADMAIVWLGAVTVPIYPSLPAGQVAPIFVDSGCVGAFVSTKEQRAKVESVRGQLPSLRWIWCFDEEPLPEERRAGVEPAATTVGPDDLATIIYTSGTTGVPKGVMLTHGNMAAEAVLALKAMAIRATDVYLSLLPLSHIFERCSGLYTMILGGTTIAYSESLEGVPANILEVRPTIVMAVPRFYEKLLARVFEVSEAAGFPRANLARWGRDVGMEWARRRDTGEPVPAPLALKHSVASRLVYSVLARKLGGRLRLRVSGGAALQRDVALFFYGAGQPIFEGYGLTETSSAICVNRFENFRIGTVGPLFDSIEVKFAEDGEILVRGPVIMKGYWNRAQDTSEALRNGWFHTGDIGTMDPDGHLRITDRKKDLIVTSGGKKVAPQPIENALRSSPKIREALVLGDGKKFVAALIVPGPGATREEIAAEVEKANSTLASFERIKRFELIPDDLTIENGFLTPSLKVKRKAVAERHRDVIERLFEGA